MNTYRSSTRSPKKFHRLDLVELRPAIADCGRLDTEPPPPRDTDRGPPLAAEDPMAGSQAGDAHD